jgi:replication factor C subunit 2/4
MFAQQKVTLPPGKHKIVILDEADSMTTAAQQAMRRTMELYSNTTRFALACNNSSEIIEPIQSRCAILRFTRLQDVELLERLKDICTKEGVKFTMDGLEALIFTADGDLRQAINALQSTAAGFDLVDQTSVFKVPSAPTASTT